jgi:hypothetical protein
MITFVKIWYGNVDKDKTRPNPTNRSFFEDIYDVLVYEVCNFARPKLNGTALLIQLDQFPHLPGPIVLSNNEYLVTFG